jgi:uncharacterized protein Usg
LAARLPEQMPKHRKVGALYEADTQDVSADEPEIFFPINLWNQKIQIYLHSLPDFL